MNHRIAYIFGVAIILSALYWENAKITDIESKLAIVESEIKSPVLPAKIWGQKSPFDQDIADARTSNAQDSSVKPSNEKNTVDESKLIERNKAFDQQKNALMSQLETNAAITAPQGLQPPTGSLGEKILKAREKQLVQ